MRTFSFFILLFSTWLIPCLLQAAIYSFVDAHGVRHFSNAPADPRYRPVVSSQTGSHPGSVKQFDKYISKAARIYDLDPFLIKAIVQVESNFKPFAVSSKGAKGLMQLMPGTSRDMGVRNPFDPEENILGGSRYLRKNLDRFDGDLKLTLAAYNAGPELVWKTGRIPQLSETRNFVREVLKRYRNYLATPDRRAKWKQYALD